MNRRSSSNAPQRYDFRRPTKLSREHVRALQIVYETFARRYATLLTSTLRALSTVSLLSIEQLSYDEYVSTLSTPTVLALVAMDPLPGAAVLEFSMGVAMASIDHMLGGPGGPQPVRALSEIETPLLRGLLGHVLGELRYAFESVVMVQPRLSSIEYNPQFVQACAASDAVVVASFEMKVGREECVATFCLPLSAIFAKLNEDASVTLSDAEKHNRDLARRRVVAGLEGAPIEVAVRFGALRLRPHDLVGLRPGDVIPLDHPVTTPLEIIAGGVTFAHGVAGNQGTRLACLIVPSPKGDARR
ncbi:MAG: flagellar motor switch protein FliM [Actinobacteria bacterium]|nr:flagellar motor switch protein FliM [Actinomycetota bacterium]